MSLYCSPFKAYLLLLFVINILMAEFYRKLINVFWVLFEKSKFISICPQHLEEKKESRFRKTIPTIWKCLLKSSIWQFATEQKVLRKRHYLFAFKVYSTQPHIGGHTLNNFPSNSDTFALIHSHTFICHRGKLYLRWIKKALRKMGDISDLKPNKGVRKSQKSVPLFHDVKESVLKKKPKNRFSFLSIPI